MRPSAPRALALALTFTAVAALATEIASAAQPATKPAGITVLIKNFDFAPMEVTAPVGASVTWKNLDEEPHTVTSADGTFHSGALDEGESFTYRFNKRGVYRYVCSIHPKMVASVTIR